MNTAAGAQPIDRAYRYVIADVFTDAPFGGNQLAVFPDARGLTAAQMQRVAREFNFAETTFVVPGNAGQPDRIRIFTPRRELPFAGHPTVGTAAVLAYLGLSRPASRDGAVLYLEEIGPVRVRTEAARGRQVFAELAIEAPLESFGDIPAPADVAAALTLPPSEILEVWCAAVGLAFCYVHLASVSAVDAAILNHQAWKSTLAHGAAPQMFIFAGDFQPAGSIYARMFAPALGIEEDPATGSASVTLVHTLARRTDLKEGTIGLLILQGVAMGRPSSMQVFADVEGGEVLRVRLGGYSVMVADGTMHI